MALGYAVRGGSVWELDDGEGERNGEKLERVGDLSPNGAFGRCLVYRVDVSQLLKVGVALVLVFTKRKTEHFLYAKRQQHSETQVHQEGAPPQSPFLSLLS